MGASAARGQNGLRDVVNGVESGAAADSAPSRVWWAAPGDFQKTQIRFSFTTGLTFKYTTKNQRSSGFCLLTAITHHVQTTGRTVQSALQVANRAFCILLPHVLFRVRRFTLFPFRSAGAPVNYTVCFIFSYLSRGCDHLRGFRRHQVHPPRPEDVVIALPDSRSSARHEYVKQKRLCDQPSHHVPGVGGKYRLWNSLKMMQMALCPPIK